MHTYVIGVLALQGAFAKHMEILRTLPVTPKEVRTPQDLLECDALIIPGGESTTISKQIRYIHLEEAIRLFAEKKPLFGTCAGLILMGLPTGNPEIISLELLDITVERNAYGRQIESFEKPVELFLDKPPVQTFPAVFIRAPRIKSCGKKVEVLSSFNQEPILIKQGHHLGATFHPELTGQSTIHRYFLKLIKEANAKKGEKA
ncbi:MAG: pyridoxal 5'-phosphate synthase glutaminase subunit PdxT [Parachlamydia sp.]|nr:MAG: pyridoxal 5'-phosphate synthase glutaminase subunit PdxT [Parachlamydia sp.]